MDEVLYLDFGYYCSFNVFFIWLLKFEVCMIDENFFVFIYVVDGVVS